MLDNNGAYDRAVHHKLEHFKIILTLWIRVTVDEAEQIVILANIPNYKD
jgi:hypothetical protein